MTACSLTTATKTGSSQILRRQGEGLPGQMYGTQVVQCTWLISGIQHIQMLSRHHHGNRIGGKFQGSGPRSKFGYYYCLVMAQESIVGQNLLFDRNVLFFNIWLHNAHTPTDYVLDGLPTDPRK